MKDITKKYTNGEVTIVWKPAQCIHSTRCWKNLSNVFDPRKRPWITPENASTEQIIQQVKECPSGALTYLLQADEPAETTGNESETSIETVANGPLLVHGNINLTDSSGNTVKKSDVTAFCRCGASGNKPYCDGSHQRTGFVG